MRKQPIPTARAGAVLCGAILLLIPAMCAGCRGNGGNTSNTGAARHYAVHGTITSINEREGYVEVDADAIPGYMAAMTMPYTMKDPKDLTRLSPGDEIEANLIFVQGVPELENIQVVKKAKSLKPAS